MFIDPARRAARRKLLRLATLLAGGWCAAVLAEPVQWSLNGFYTVSALRTDRSGPLFLYAPFGDQDRPARQQQWDVKPDSKFGVMVGANWSPAWSARAQWMLRQGSSKERDLKTRLAFIEYRPRYDISLKIGRTVQGLLPVEEAMFTDYANLLARAPQEPYVYLPNSEIDGIKFDYDTPAGPWTCTLQASLGQATYHSQQFLRRLRDSAGVAASLSSAKTTARIAFRSIRLGLLEAPALAAAAGFVRDVAETQGRGDIAASYDERAIRLRTFSLSLEHVDGPWTLRADLLGLNSTFRPLGTAISFNAVAGYRAGAWTPYIGSGRIRDLGERTEDRLAVSDAAGMAAAGTANYLTAAISGAQRTVTAGIRVELDGRTALKLQFDRVYRKADAVGWFVPPAEGPLAPSYSNATNVATIALQGVF